MLHVRVCEQACSTHSAGNSAVENSCILLLLLYLAPFLLQTEDLQENELFSASCQLVCEWAGRLLYCVCVSDFV